MWLAAAEFLGFYWFHVILVDRIWAVLFPRLRVSFSVYPVLCILFQRAALSLIIEWLRIIA